MSIELANESGIDVPVDLVLDAARFAIDRMDVHPGAELSVICVDLDTMADLHMRWMDLPGPTDVMSFPMDELTPGSRQSGDEPGPATLGDIVLCPEFAKTQAKRARHSFDHELAVLTVHGVLHLLGYDHAEPEEGARCSASRRRSSTSGTPTVGCATGRSGSRGATRTCCARPGCLIRTGTERGAV